MRYLSLAALLVVGTSCGSDLAEGQTSVVLTVKNSAEAPVPVEVVIRPLANGMPIPGGTIAVPVNKPPGSDGVLGTIVFLPPAQMMAGPDGGSSKVEYSFAAEGKTDKRSGAPVVSQGSVSYKFVSGRQQRATLVLWKVDVGSPDAGTMVTGDAGTGQVDAK